MSKTKVCIIINPKSGTDNKKDIPLAFADQFDQTKYDIYIRITGYAGHATEIARQAVKEGYQFVIAVGGDGTVNEIAKELINTDTILGIIPSGSGNGLARDLNIPFNLNRAIEVMKEGHIRTIDYGSANGHLFFCTCGVGFDAFISDKFADDSMRGPLGYVRNMVEGVIDFKPEEYCITHDEGQLRERAFLVTCANASQYGNEAYIAPDADMEDGLMNVSILKPLNPNEIPHTTFQLFTKNIDKNSKMISLLTSKLTIEREQAGVLHIDGDPVEAGKQIEVEIHPQGLQVFAPKQLPARREKENLLTTLNRLFSIT